MQSIRVLHVAETLRGGIASYLEEILPAQVDHYGQDQVALLAPALQLQDLAPLPGLQVLACPSEGGRLIRTCRLAWKLHCLVRTTTYDVIHAHSTFAGIAMRCVLGWRRQRPRLVYCAHGWAFDRLAPKLHTLVAQLLERVLARCTDAIVCISRHDLNSARNAMLPTDRLVLLTNAISAQFTIPPTPVSWPHEGIKVLFVGRFDRQKGSDIFASAMALLGTGWCSVAIGSRVVDDSSPTLFPANITALGWLPRTQVQQYLASCDVLVVPSRWEGFGLVALEAMRAGKAVVAARVGGLAEIVVDGVTGRLVTPGSAPELADTLRSLTPAELHTLGSAGYNRFLRQYTADDLNQGLFELYGTLVMQPSLSFLAR